MNVKPVVRNGKSYPFGRWLGKLTTPKDIAIMLAIMIPIVVLVPTLDLSMLGPAFDPPPAEGLWILYAANGVVVASYFVTDVASMLWGRRRMARLTRLPAGTPGLLPGIPRTKDI